MKKNNIYFPASGGLGFVRKNRSGRQRRKDTTSETKGTVTDDDILKASGAFSMMAYLSDKYVKRLEPGNMESPFDRGDGTAVGPGGQPFRFGEDDGLYFEGAGIR